MARSLIILFATFLIIPNNSNSKSVHSPEELTKVFVKYFVKKQLNKMDRLHPKGKTIRIIVEYAIFDKNPYKIERFKKFKKIDGWLGQHTGLNRPITKFDGCKKGVCVFHPADILHNTLYLKMILYSYHKGRPYIEAVIFYDGS